MTNDNPTLTIRVEGKQVGQRTALFGARTIALPPGTSAEDSGVRRLKLRDLIAFVVRGEVAAYDTRQQDRQIARALTADQIAAGAARGKIDSGGLRDAEPDAADPETAVVAALLAFSDGLYYVFLEDRQQTDLDAEITLRSDDRVTFLRLVALAGG